MTNKQHVGTDFVHLCRYKFSLRGVPEDLSLLIGKFSHFIVHKNLMLCNTNNGSETLKFFGSCELLQRIIFFLYSFKEIICDVICARNGSQDF